jgi:Fic family protein
LDVNQTKIEIGQHLTLRRLKNKGNSKTGKYMSNDDTNKEVNNVPNKIKFDFDQAKTTTQQSLEMEDAAASGQELDEESPTQHKFVRFRGKSWEELLKVHGVKLSGPDGEDIKYVVQITDPTTFSKVNMMCDNKIKEYVIAPYVSDTGVERIWFGESKSE